MADDIGQQKQKGTLRAVIKRSLILATGLLIMFSFIGYCIAYRQKLVVLLEVRATIIVGIIVLVLVHRGALALRFRTLCRPYGAEVSFWDAYLLVLISSAINLVSPIRGGFVTRAIYLKKKHGLYYSYMPSLILVSTILSFIVGGIVILSTNVVWIFMGKSGVWPLVVFGCVLSLSAVAFVVKPPRFLLNLPGEIGKNVNMSCEGWEMMRRNLKSMSAVCGYHFLVIFISGILTITGFYAVHLPLTFPAAVSISVINTFTGVVNLTPANFGIQEWTTAFVANLSGLDFHGSVAAALIIRAAGILVNVIGGAVGYYLLFLRPSGYHDKTSKT